MFIDVVAYINLNSYVMMIKEPMLKMSMSYSPFRCKLAQHFPKKNTSSFSTLARWGLIGWYHECSTLTNHFMHTCISIRRSHTCSLKVVTN